MPRATTTKKNTTAPKSTKNLGAVETKAEVKVEQPKKEKPEITMQMLVPCVSMVRDGELIYASKRLAGYMVRWHGFMDMQFVEMNELVSMKSTDIAFFINNWIVIPDSYELKKEVMEYLGIDRFYNNAMDVEAINNLFDAPVNVIIDKVKAMSDVSKDAVRTVAEKAIKEGTLDSFQKIQALESVLNCSLV